MKLTEILSNLPPKHRLMTGLSTAALFLLHCGSGAPPLDAEATLSLHAAANSLKNNGDTVALTIRATVDGQPAFDGTEIWLNASLGQVPEKVVLVDGVASTFFRSDDRLGQVTVIAGRTPGASDDTVTLTVEDSVIPLGTPLISYSPTNLTVAGGVVDIRVRVIDDQGAPLPDEAVVISTDHGFLEQGNRVNKSDKDGWVVDYLRVQGAPVLPEAIHLTFSIRGELITGNTITVTANENPKPQIHVSNPTVLLNDVVVFNGASSRDPDDTSALDGESLRWNFGDGSETTTGVVVEHRYSRPGTYTATLAMTDAHGATVTAEAPVTVTPPVPNEPPTAAFAISPDTVDIGRLVTFNAAASADPDGELVAYHWDFGDGGSDEGLRSSRVYAGAGEYNVTLTVEDDMGARASVTNKVVVNGNKLPLAMLSVSSDVFRPGQAVAFDASESTDPDGRGLASFTYDFGDGSPRKTSSLPTTTHTYDEVGLYLARVDVRDVDGGVAYATAAFQVSEAALPEPSFAFEPEIEIRPGTVIRFTARGSQSVDSPIAGYRWFFGDGGIGDGAEVTHAYAEAGEYSVKLTVTAENGLSDSSVKVIRIQEFAKTDGAL